jgi:hypothetical protein
MSRAKLETTSLKDHLHVPDDWSLGERVGALEALIIEGCRSLTGEPAIGVRVGLNVPGSEVDRPTLTARRKELAERYGRHERTIREWHYRGGHLLAEWLQARIRDLNTRAAWSEYRRQLPLEPLQQERQPRHSFDKVETIVRLRRRIVLEHVTLRWLVALDDGLTHYHARMRYYSDHRPGVTKITPLVNCTVGESAFAPQGHHLMNLMFPAPLSSGQRHFFAYRVAVDTDQDMHPVLNYQPKLADDQEYIIRMQFDPAAPPRRLSWFAGVQIFTDTMGPPLDERHPIETNEIGYVEKQFTGLTRGLHYGLAWEWD